MTSDFTQEQKVDIRSAVRDRYGQIAETGKAAEASGCCGEVSCCGGDVAQLAPVQMLYDDPGVADLPEEVTGLSLGCGDPVTLAALAPGETVLDLGAGGGIDCFLAARKVGPAGQVIGVDMTPAMLERARANQAQLGLENVSFRLGEIEHLPVADASVDVILSNCVVNLSPDKPQVFREAFRVLRPGGRLAVSDIVTDGPLPGAVKNSLSAWAGCVAGALDVAEYVAAIEAAGFEDVVVSPTYWDDAMVEEAVAQLDPEVAATLRALPEVKAAGAEALRTTVFSARIQARRPEVK